MCPNVPVKLPLLQQIWDRYLDKYLQVQQFLNVHTSNVVCFDVVDDDVLLLQNSGVNRTINEESIIFFLIFNFFFHIRIFLS